MPIQEKTRSDAWKDKYFKALNEFDDQERSWSEQLARVNRDLVRVLENFRDHDREFDRQLDAAASTARQHSDANQARLGELVTRAAEIAAAADQPAAAAGASPDNLTVLIDALVVPAEHAGLVDELRETLRLGRGDEFSDSIEIIAGLAAKISEIIANSSVSGRAEGGDAMQTLLDHLSLPESAQKKVAAFTEQLTRAKDDATLRRIAKDLANFLVEYVATLRAELTGLNAFLLTIKSRLEHVSTHIASDDHDRSQASAAREQLDVDVKRGLDDMRDKVRSANNIEDLKVSISDQIAELDGNVSNFLSSESGRSSARQDANRELARQVLAMEKESTALRKELIEAQARASHDALTGLPNRAAYDDRLLVEHARMRRHGTPLSLVVIDLDKFKSVNDTWGHQAGDRVLKHVARELSGRTRKQDFFGRFGGEEFVLLLPDTELAGALRLAENLRKHIDVCRFVYKDDPVDVTISCGVAEFTNGEDASAVFERADSGLYKAKSNGRNRCEALQSTATLAG